MRLPRPENEVMEELKRDLAFPRLLADPKNRDAWGLLLSLAPSLFFLRELIFGALTPASPDIINMFAPLYAYARRSLLNGELPVWNPYSGSGMPFLADPQTAVFYPINLLRLFFETPQGIPYTIFAHYLLASAFMYLYVRTIGGGVFGSTFAAIAFAYSGYYLAQSYNPTLLGAILWVPLIFLFAERAMRGPSLFYASLAGLAWAFQVFAGSLQITYYTSLALLGYFLVGVARQIVLARQQGRPLAWNLFLVPPTFLLAALAFAAPQLIATAGYLNLSNLAEGYRFSVAGSLNSLVELRVLFGQNHFWIEGIRPYAGAIALLAAISAPFLRRDFYSLLFAVLSIVVVLLAFGQKFFIYDILTIVPGFAQVHAHWPTRILFLWVFALAVLGGLAMDRLWQVNSERPKPLPTFALAGLGAMAAAAVFFDLPTILLGRPPTTDILPLLTFSMMSFATMALVALRQVRVINSVVFGLFLLVLTLGDLFYGLNTLGLQFLPLDKVLAKPIAVEVLEQMGVTSFDSNRVASPRIVGLDPEKLFGIKVKVAPRLLIPDYPLYYGIPEAQNYGPLIPRHYRELVDFNNGGPFEYHNTIIQNFGSKTAALMGIGYAVTEASYAREVARDTAFNVVWEGAGTAILRNEAALPYIYFVRQAEVIREDSRALARLNEADFDPRQRVILREAPVDGRIQAEVLAGAAPAISWKRPSAHRVLVKATLPQAGFLVWNESYYPAWKARVNGKERRIYIANYAFQAIYVDEGEQEIEFTFSSPDIGAGLSLSALALVVTLSLPFLPGLRQRIRRDVTHQ